MNEEIARIRQLRAKELLDFYMSSQWYPVQNDLIGGWCIMPVNEGPSCGIPEVADFLSEEMAKHIAHLHNLDLLNKGIA